ncbi:MAG: cation:proton antiporter [Thermoplasmata archaeon]|nr:cation:proton antiporter [Thermoplasmata archaeon]
MYDVDPIIVFAIILTISLIVPELLKEVKMIIVPFYIIGGMVLGPHGLGFEANDALVFVGDIGILFLVFIAGLEIREYGKIDWKKPVHLSIISAGTCFLFGFLLGNFWGYELITCFLLGTILMSSSVGEIIPIVASSAHLREKFSDFLIPAIIIMDASSLFLLALLIQWGSDIFKFILFLIQAFLLILLLVHLLPRLSRWFFSRKILKPRETDLKFVLTVLIISVALGYIIGLHGIIIAFLVGTILGHHIPNEKTHEKLHGFGYGFFIPIFFVVLGMSLDISFLFSGAAGIILIGAIIGTLITSKIIGALIFSRLKRIPKREGLVLGVTLWPQLSATLAAAAVGFEYGIFDSELLTAVVFMSIITATATPFFVHALVRSEGKKHGMKGHILIVGYGRTSARLAYLLDMDSKDFIVIDRKLSRVRLLRSQGIEAILGSGDELNVLRKANIEHTRIVVITIPDDHEVYLCAKHIKEANEDCHIIARVHDWASYEKLKQERLIDFAVWPEKLSSEIIIKHIIDSEFWENEDYDGVE